jgi:melibiase-like protein
MHPAYRLLFLISLCTLIGFGPARASDQLAVASVDAAINCGRGICAIGNGTVQLQLTAQVGAPASPARLLLPQTGQAWTLPDVGDGLLTVDGRVRRIGAQSDGFLVTDLRAFGVPDGVQLDMDLSLGQRVALTRHYALYDGSPTFEVWTSVRSADGLTHTLSDLNAFSLTVPGGVLRWVNGLQGDNADVDKETAFSLDEQTLDDGQAITLGSTRRSSEQTIPWIVADGGDQSVFAGLMWSGAWRLTATRRGRDVALTGGLASMNTMIGAGTASEGPHGFFGVVPGGAAHVTAAMQAFIVNGVRSGRPLTPLVTYNTWFAYGTAVDEPAMHDEMTRVAALGTELFVLDAGWYTGGGALGLFDFSSGLGTWEPDPARFPNGLKPLTDYAHQLGMKFGVWVEPEQVDLNTVGWPGSDESWLATEHGSYGSQQAGQLCLASARARRWVFDRLTALIDSVQPDYLKWDNNMWLNCDREGHGHGTTDGNFAHVQGLYDLLGALRARYPDLMIENVSGGGNRLDVGMLRYTDAAWMDDRTAPSVRVRHNVEGLSSLFPPAYLLSFAVSHFSEPLESAPDLALYLRSRMQGVMGLCFLSAGLSDTDAAHIAREIAIYKTFRDALSNASASLLTPQAVAQDGPAWDVLQAQDMSSGAVVLSAFQIDHGTTKTNVKPRDLDPALTYDVRSVDQGPLGSATGASLMRDGIDILGSPLSAAHVLILTVSGAAAPNGRTKIRGGMNAISTRPMSPR